MHEGSFIHQGKYFVHRGDIMIYVYTSTPVRIFDIKIKKYLLAAKTNSFASEIFVEFTFIKD